MTLHNEKMEPGVVLPGRKNFSGRCRKMTNGEGIQPFPPPSDRFRNFHCETARILHRSVSNATAKCRRGLLTMLYITGEMRNPILRHYLEHFSSLTGINNDDNYDFNMSACGSH